MKASCRIGAAIVRSYMSCWILCMPTMSPNWFSYSEGFAMLQNAGARLAKRAGGLDAELRLVLGLP